MRLSECECVCAHVLDDNQTRNLPIFDLYKYVDVVYKWFEFISGLLVMLKFALCIKIISKKQAKQLPYQPQSLFSIMMYTL